MVTFTPIFSFHLPDQSAVFHHLPISVFRNTGFIMKGEIHVFSLYVRKRKGVQDSDETDK